MTVEEVAFAELRDIAKQAAREHVSLAFTRHTRWFVVRVDGDIGGCAGLLRLPNGGFRLKGAWTRPHLRGRGIGLALVEHRLHLVETEMAGFVETLSLHPAFFEARGFRREKVMLNGAVKMRKLL